MTMPIAVAAACLYLAGAFLMAVVDANMRARMRARAKCGDELALALVRMMDQSPLSKWVHPMLWPIIVVARFVGFVSRFM